MLFNVAILTQSTTRETVASDAVSYHRRVRASDRMEAIQKCLPDIQQNVLPHVDSSIKYVSVFAGRVGHGGMALRLCPIQIVRATGQIRRSN